MVNNIYSAFLCWPQVRGFDEFTIKNNSMVTAAGHLINCLSPGVSHEALIYL